MLLTSVLELIQVDFQVYLEDIDMAKAVLLISEKLGIGGAAPKTISILLGLEVFKTSTNLFSEVTTKREWGYLFVV